MSEAGSTKAKPDQDNFLRKAGPLVMARLVAAAITFFIPLVLARLLALEDYGTYKQLFLIGHTLYFVLPFGMAQALYFFVPRTEDPRPFFVHSLLFLLGMGALAAGALGLCAGWVAEQFQNPALYEHRWTLGVYTGGIIASASLELMMTSRGKTVRSAITYLVSDSLRTAAMMVPVLLGFGVRGMMWAMAAFAVARVVAAWAMVLAERSGKLFDRKLLWSQLAYAAPFGAAMVLNMPQQYAHQFAVSALVPPALFAIYAVGCFQLPLVELLYTPTSEMLMVRLGELDRQKRMEEAVYAFREATAKLSYVFLPMAAFLFAAAPEFIAAMFGERFLEAVPLFRVSVVAIALAIFPLDGTLRARNATRYLFVSYFLKAAVTVPLVYFLVRGYGMMGGILSWLLAELFGKATLFARIPWALSTPEVRRSFAELVPWRALGQASLAAALGAAGVLGARALAEGQLPVIPQGFLWRVLPLAVAGTLFLFAYLASLRLTGVRPLEAMAVFLRRRPA